MFVKDGSVSAPAASHSWDCGCYPDEHCCCREFTKHDPDAVLSFELLEMRELGGSQQDKEVGWGLVKGLAM